MNDLPETAALLADAALAHFAVVRDGLWSPSCSDQWGWVVPLTPTWSQVTCPGCRAKHARPRSLDGDAT
jgi:hypothetical protein